MTALASRPTCRIASRSSTHLVAVVALAAVLLGPARAPGQTNYTWTQPTSGTSANWSAGPWSPGTPASGTGTLLNFNVFSGRSAYTFTNDLGPFTVNGIALNDWSTNLLT